MNSADNVKHLSLTIIDNSVELLVSTEYMIIPVKRTLQEMER